VPTISGAQCGPVHNRCHHDAHGSLGQIRVPSAPAARRCVMAVPTACVWGEIQLFSPGPTDGEGVCLLRVGVEEAGTEAPRVGGDQGLAVFR
jgi:hypothetical protein